MILDGPSLLPEKPVFPARYSTVETMQDLYLSRSRRSLPGMNRSE